MSKQQDTLDKVFMALADKTRRELIHRLANRSMTILELSDGLEMSLAAVSKHIKVLEKAMIVSRRIEGRKHIISLVPERLGLALDWVSIYRNFWQGRLDKLTNSLENTEKE